MAELNIGIAGVRTAVVTRDAKVAAVVRDRFEGFVCSGRADWRIDIHRPSATIPPSHDVVVTRNGAPARFSVTRRDFTGTVDVAEHTAHVSLTSSHDVSEEVSIESFWRIFYSLALLEADGLVVHAASLVRHGRAYLFPGPSGAGKTTVARLSPDATLLSDELSIVRIADGTARCFGTPFRGELALAGDNRSAPLAGIYFLRQGSAHALQSLTAGQAVARLLPNVLFFAREPDVTARVFRIATDLIDAVPCFDLSFSRDPGFWEVILDG